MNNDLKVVDLFAGIGGMSLGLGMAGGFETVAFCEINPFCRAVLKKHWPGVPRMEDITRVQPEDLPEADLWTAGFPCVDISDAGRRAGISAPRSGLWREVVRCLRVVRPPYLLVENVAALLRRGMDVVVGDLAESGYDAEWDCIPAAAVGAPHLRDRAFIVAYPGVQTGRSELSGRREQQPESGTEAGATADATRRGQPGLRRARGRAGQPDGVLPEVSDAELAGLERPRIRWATPDCVAWLPEPGVCRVDDGLPNQVDRLAALGNAVVPQVVAEIGRALTTSAQKK